MAYKFEQKFELRKMEFLLANAAPINSYEEGLWEEHLGSVGSTADSRAPNKSLIEPKREAA